MNLDNAAAAALLVPAARREGGGRHDRRRPRQRRHRRPLRPVHSAEPAGLLGRPTGTAIRGTSYIYPNTPIDRRRRAAYAPRASRSRCTSTPNCADWTPASARRVLRRPARAVPRELPSSLPAPVTNRTHCIVWSDYATQPKVELAHGIRLDTNYYYFRPTAGSRTAPACSPGPACRCASPTSTARPIDVYQAATQMTDESGQTYPFTVNTLLDAALGRTATTASSSPTCTPTPHRRAGSDAIVASALARGVPVVSAQADARLARRPQRFVVQLVQLERGAEHAQLRHHAGAGANGLEAMVPVRSATGVLTSLTAERDPGRVHHRGDQGGRVCILRWHRGHLCGTVRQ